METILPVKNRGGRASTWAEPRLRAEALSAKYEPDQIIKFAQEIAAGKKTPLSSQDAIICINLANIYEMRSGEERERLYNRIFGKVPDKAINLNLNIDATPQQLSDRAQALLDDLDPQPEPVAFESEAIEDDHSDLIDEG